MSRNENNQVFKGRIFFVLILLALLVSVLLWRSVHLHVISKNFLQQQGDARFLRDVSVAADRGMIVDRNGDPLAISTPVDSVWANPKELIKHEHQWLRLSVVLNIDYAELRRNLSARRNKEFIYLKRHVTPQLAEKIEALNIPGVHLNREYHRYYPAGEVTAHVVGFTDIDDNGQEGMELAYENWLKAKPGIKRVIKDRMGRIVEDVEQVKLPSPGENLILTLDKRVQYLAYRELKSAVQLHNADAGTVVILDATNGEVLAMANQPAFNPNQRNKHLGTELRNRAVTDVFEPGSTVKPFTVMAALASGKYNYHSLIDTSPGVYRVGRKLIRDFRDYGEIDLSTLIQKSSNIGASKLALSIDSKVLWETFSGVGFGQISGSGFPGEISGTLSDYMGWHDIERATLSFGYGVSVTALQLARAYTVFANDGMVKDVQFIRGASRPHVLPVSSQRNTHINNIKRVRKMLETVTVAGGTGVNARVPGYRIAGKTGTVKKSGQGGYIEDSYLSVFVGMAPASNPKLVMVVMINEPRGDKYYGGAVAAPVFSKVMAGALRMLDVPPDNLPALDSAKLALLDGVK